jgi:hypothetical protein
VFGLAAEHSIHIGSNHIGSEACSALDWEEDDGRLTFAMSDFNASKLEA